MLKTNNMLNKQMGGYGLRVSSEAGEEVKKSPIKNAQEKTQDLINANPGGTTITKFSDSINDQLTQYLPVKKQELAELEKIKALGSEAEGYSEAVEGINAIEKELIQLNADLESAAMQRKQLLDTQVSGAYAMSNTDEQAYNFHNFANGTFGEEAEIIDGKLTYFGKLYDEVDVGGEYNYDLEDLVEETFSETRELAYGNEPVDVNEYNNVYRKNLENNLNKLVRGNDGESAVKDYMYQNRELIDTFISNQTGKEITPEFKESKEYKELYDLNKTTVDFRSGFVETVLGMHDYILFESKESEEMKSELTAEEIIKKFS